MQAVAQLSRRPPSAEAGNPAPIPLRGLEMKRHWIPRCSTTSSIKSKMICVWGLVRSSRYRTPSLLTIVVKRRNVLIDH